MLYALPSARSSPSPYMVRDVFRPDDDFREDLREFISRRLDKIDPYRESGEYAREQERASRLYDELRELLPEEGRGKLLEYSEALGAAHCLEMEIAAEHAFVDGMRTVLKVVMSYEC